MTEATATGGLGWVRAEINASLRAVREWLDAAATAPPTAANSALARTALQEVQGVLLALGLATPGRLISEALALLDAVLADTTGDPGAAVEALRRALDQFGVYLDRLEAEQPAPPRALWPAIQALRAAHGQPAAATDELQALASTEAVPDDTRRSPEFLEPLAARIRRVRPQFHRALLHWYRGDAGAHGLEGLERFCQQLARTLSDPHLADLFLVAERLIAARQARGGDRDPLLRTLVGHLDRVFKPLAAEPPVWPDDEVRSLTGQFLDALGALDVHSPELDAVHLRMADTLASGLAARPGEQAFAQSVRDLIDELELAQRQLERLSRGQPFEQGLRDSIPRALREGAAILLATPAAELAPAVERLAVSLDGLPDLDATVDLARMESIAADLLSLQSALHDQIGLRAVDGEEPLFPGLDASDLIEVTLRETGYELLRVKQAVGDTHELGIGNAGLVEVPNLLFGISGALRVLDRPAAADLTERMGAFIRLRYLESQRTPSAAQFEHLADILAALEFFINETREGRGGDHLIVRARDALKALEREAGQESIPAAKPVADQQPSAPVPLADTVTAPAAGIDPEVLDIFLEEARDEAQAASDNLARWRIDGKDREALTTLRRSFHTLKGSGRLVGAQRVADIAAATETLLNRVLAGELAAAPPLVDGVAAIVARLPGLIEAEAQARPIDVAVLLELLERAVAEPALAEPEPEPEPSLPALEVPLPEPEPSLPALEVPLPEPEPSLPAHAAASAEPELTDRASLFIADDELLDIFVNETAEHLEVLREQLRACARGETRPDEVTRRALHTLTGSARMAGVASIAAVTKPLEVRVKALLASGKVLDPQFQSHLGRAVDLIAARIGELPGAGHAADGLQAFAQELAGSAAGLDATLDAALALELGAAEARSAPLEPALEAVPPPLEVAGTDLPPLDFPPPAIQADTEDVAPDPEMAEIFLEEARDLLDQLDQRFQDWQLAPATTEPLDAINRLLHTLKGGARLAGLPLIGDLSHALESRLKGLGADPEQGACEAALELTQRALDTLANQVDALAQGAPVPHAHELVAALHATDEPPETAPTPGPIPAPTPALAPAPADLAETEPTAPDPEMAAIFLEEARDLLEQLDQRFRDWQLAPTGTEPLDAINRLLHTLKGGARLTGLPVIGNLSHALESRLKGLGADPEQGACEAALELTQRALDTLANQVDALAQGAPVPHARELVAILNATDGEPEPETIPAAPAAATPEPAPAPAASPAAAAPAAAPREAAASAPQLRVSAELLNRLVDRAGEISIYRARLTQRNNQLGFGLGELDQTLARLRDKLRALEIETQFQILHRLEREGLDGAPDSGFDPLELDRFSKLQQLSGSLAETVNDLMSVKDLIGGYQRECADLLTQQARLADELQDGLLRTRLVPFVQIVPRLHRLVRQTADALGKSAQLEIVGQEVGLDRSVLDRLVAPLEHLLRNAVDHGLEDPAGRAAAGKPAVGRIELTLRREGNDAVLIMRDDGRGMNLEAIRRKAIARGWLAPDAAPPDDTLLQFILEPGFTTQEQVTQISGRGVGLDVVASEIKAANGAIQLASHTGHGATFTIRLPLTLAMIEAFLVSVGDTMYAVPHSTVEGAGRIARQDLVALYAGTGRTFTHLGHPYKVVYLGGVLDARQQPDIGERRWLPLLLARQGDQRVALQVDSLLESQRILVKSLGPQLAGVRWLSGGTILPDGRVALILDALTLLRSGLIQGYRPSPADLSLQGSGAPCVMVVDDSLTVRRVTSRLLRRQAFDVITAKDGVEALTLLDERIPDIMLLDIEMPRMDGYELTRHIRRSDRLRTLPIIMITSRTGDKHREHAMQLGVDRYLGKPYQESELLAEIAGLLEERAHAEP